MARFTAKEILDATKGILIEGKEEGSFNDVSTDTRKITNGNLFIPIEGEKFDGHSFIKEARLAGAAGCLAHKYIDGVNDRSFTVIKVNDTKTALGDLAKFHRNRSNIKVCGITGSVGKTSTKDMTYEVLSRGFNVHKTQGNFNNEIGLPITLLEVKAEHNAAVVEMGMRGLGEIEYLSGIAQPDIAIITNIGLSHIERLGSQENIFKAKMEIISGLRKDGTLIINADDDFLKTIKHDCGFNLMTVGINNKDVFAYADNIRYDSEDNITMFNINVLGGVYPALINAPGKHNIYNALCAACAGISLGMSMAEIVNGIACFKTEGMRQNIIELSGAKIINDAYNANPASMDSALDLLMDVKADGRKIAVLGDMFELGEMSNELHYRVGERVVRNKIDYLVTIGTKAGYIAAGAETYGLKKKNIKKFKAPEEAGEFLRDFIEPGDFVLVKASRAMKLEKVIEILEAKNLMN